MPKWKILWILHFTCTGRLQKNIVYIYVSRKYFHKYHVLLHSVLPWHQTRLSKTASRILSVFFFFFLQEIFEHDALNKYKSACKYKNIWRDYWNFSRFFTDVTEIFFTNSRICATRPDLYIIESLSPLFVQFVLTSANDPNAENEM